MPPPPASRPDRILRGIGSMIVCVTLFSIVHILVKSLASRYPIVQIMFFRSALALVPALVLIARHPRGFALLRTRRPRAHAARSMLGMFAMATMFAAFRYLPAADVVAINFAAPLFVTALSVPLLREPVGMRRWTAVLVGFVGVLVMLQPGSIRAGDHALLGSMLALASAMAYAFVVIVIRQMSRDEPSLTIVVVYMTCVATATGAVLPFVWMTPTAVDLAVFVAVGLVGGFAQVFLTRAFEAAPPAVVMPFEYLSLVVTALLAWVIWTETPGGLTMVGAAIVIASGLFILYREARLARVKPPSAP
ncbi:MAG: DMT family transporter [Alphaproteobacteria bacterium]|nr:DMT family transporter [Alphaproteobacteria bacterium]